MFLREGVVGAAQRRVPSQHGSTTQGASGLDEIARLMYDSVFAVHEFFLFRQHVTHAVHSQKTRKDTVNAAVFT